MEKNKEKISAMFDSIAPKYDFLNHALSLGIDNNWRKKIRKILEKNNPQTVLDIATGTADLAIEISKIPSVSKIYGIDISKKMIEYGTKKIQKKKLNNKIKLHVGDALNIPFQDNTFDAVTCAFGVRNFENLNKGLQEMYRILKPSGTLVILEFAMPNNKIINSLYSLYFKKILPFIGKKISKNNYAYSYLPASVSKFPYGIDFVEILKHHNYINTKFFSLSFNISNIYVAEKQ